MSEESLRKMVEDRNRFLRGVAGEILKIHDECLGTRYMALPKASLWTRLKVRWKNWRLKRTVQDKHDD